MTLKIDHAEFVRGATKPEQWPDDGLPEIAFCGRSNVGKSSLLNTLVMRRKLALVSNTPGRTRQNNFFLINNSFYFVDLPGYGFARAPFEEKARWGRMVETYLSESSQLRGLIVILDIRRTPNDDDLQMIEWARHFGAPVLLALTKLDKISRNARAKSASLIMHTLKAAREQAAAAAFKAAAKARVEDVLDADEFAAEAKRAAEEVKNEPPHVVFSAKTREGREAVLSHLKGWL